MATERMVEMGAVVMVAMSGFKCVELLLGRIRNGRNGDVTVTLKEISRTQTKIAERMSALVRQQEQITGAMQKHETEMALWLSKDCPRGRDVERASQDLALQVDRLKQIVK